MILCIINLFLGGETSSYLHLLIPSLNLCQLLKLLRFYYLFFVLDEKTEDINLDIPKIYEPISSFHQLQNRLNKFLHIYNENVRGTGMDMVFFEDAMVHLVKVQSCCIAIGCCSLAHISFE